MRRGLSTAPWLVPGEKCSREPRPAGYDKTMSDAYDELLDATIQHLEGLKSRGVRHVAVSSETLRALALPVKSQISNLKSQNQPAGVADAPAARFGLGSQKAPGGTIPAAVPVAKLPEVRPEKAAEF